jgi:hypothetical protein
MTDGAGPVLTDRDAPHAAPSPNDVDWVAEAGASQRTLRGTTSLVPHLAWLLLGAVTIPAAWYAWSLPGGIALFTAIAASFVLWHVFGSRGSWVALIVIGVGMSGLLGWQAATGARCPADGTKVFLKENKPPIGCSDVRASATTMSAFFGMVALIGIGAPLYARRVERD